MEYLPLHTKMNEIRLITILPRDYGDTLEVAEEVKQQDPICCRLEHVCLDNRFKFKEPSGPVLPPGIWNQKNQTQESDPQRMQWRYTWGDYVALSYVWGDATVTRQIFINGQSMQVSVNLEAALRELREKTVINSGCKVWVDAICINQGNLEERHLEIKRMQTIYQRALDVVIWLGSEADDSNIAMDFMNELSGCWDLDSKDKLKENLGRELKARHLDLWKAINALMSRPYWDRLWVLQEIVMGGRSAPVLCGSRAVIWDDFYKALYYLNNPPKDAITGYVDEVLRDVGLGLWDLDRYRLYWRWNRVHDLYIFQSSRAKGQAVDLTALLRVGRRRLATDSRDKVYGLMGLLDGSLRSRINPDYTAPVHEVYQSFAQAYIEATGHLEILSECGGYSQPWANPALPSWAPDWSSIHSDFRHLTASHEPNYNAGGPSAVITSISPTTHPSHLTCRALLLGTLDGLSSAYWPVHDPSATNIAIRDRLTPASQPASNPYGTDSALATALWRTLLGDRDLQNVTAAPAPPRYAVLLDAFDGTPPGAADVDNRLGEGLGFMRRNAGFLVAGRRLDTFFPLREGPPPPARDNTLVEEVLTRFGRWAWVRRLAVTGNGWVGMVPFWAERGDVVAVVWGSSLPMLLREVDRGEGEGKREAARYKILSPVYFHGVMGGEALEWVAEGKAQAVDVTII